MTGPVQLSIEPGGVAVVLLDRSGVGNAIDLPMAAALADTFERLDKEPSVRAVVLGGAGGSFCVGGDVGAMARAVDRREFLHELATEAHRAILAVARLRAPVVVAVQGPAAGAGLALTLQADAVVASESSKFVAAYLGVGLTPDCGLSLMLPTMVGVRTATDLLLNNRVLNATDALALGLVNEVVPDKAVMDNALGLARAWARLPYPAAGNARWLVRREMVDKLAVHLDLEAAAIAEAAASDASIALIDAFAEKSSRLRAR